MRDLAKVTLEHRDGVSIAHMAGQIDLSNAQDLRASLEAAAAEASSGLVVDLSDVTYLDSAGVRLLFQLEERLGEAGKRLRAVVPESAPIRRVLLLANVARAVPVDTTLEEAIAELEVLA